MLIYRPTHALILLREGSIRRCAISSVLPSATQSAAVNVENTGNTASQTLWPVYQVAVVDVSVPCDISQSLCEVSQIAVADVGIRVDIAQTLATVTQSAVAERWTQGYIEQTLGGWSQAAQTEVGLSVDIAQTLAPVSQQAATIVFGEIGIDGGFMLATVTQDAEASVGLSAQIAQTLATVEQLATINTYSVFGNTVQTLSPVTQWIGAHVSWNITASIEQDLWAVSQTVVPNNNGVVYVVCDIDQTLATATQSANIANYRRFIDVSAIAVDSVLGNVLAFDTVVCDTVHEDSVELEATV